MPEQLEVGYYEVRFIPGMAGGDGPENRVAYFDGSRWCGTSDGPFLAQRCCWKPIKPRLLERSEVEGKLADAHRKLDWLIGFVSAPVTRESLKEIKAALDALCPASVEIKCGQWYASGENQFRLPMRIEGDRITNLLVEGDEIRVNVNSRDRFQRLATEVEQLKLRQLVTLST